MRKSLKFRNQAVKFFHYSITDMLSPFNQRFWAEIGLKVYIRAGPVIIKTKKSYLHYGKTKFESVAALANHIARIKTVS